MKHPTFILHINVGLHETPDLSTGIDNRPMQLARHQHHHHPISALK
jgi:hypothetical protein